MNKEYKNFVMSKVKSGTEIASNMSPDEAHLIHMAMGIAGEAGELLDCIKKHTMYKKPLDIKNLVEELGDLEFYMEGIRHAVAIPRELTISANVIKLSKRYPKRYSNKDAQERADKQ
ncbi:MAG: nucleotide pyrophosphohydrolase [Sphingobacteriia bacterium]|nr:nucleotide pyrophosphohydrolase [Sphingobacteriia bacterium]